MKTRTVLYADPGMVLTDGETYGKQIFLGDGRSAEEYYEITDEEMAAIEQERLDDITQEDNVQMV